MRIRGKLERLEKAAFQDFCTYHCSGCGAEFKLPARAWLTLLAADWQATAEGSTDLRDDFVRVLEAHIRHGGELYEDGRRIWPLGEAVQ